jgi:hypothetical protein
MGLKSYRLWDKGQLDSTCRAPPVHVVHPRGLQLVVRERQPVPPLGVPRCSAAGCI